jgi:hypothetical protein
VYFEADREPVCGRPRQSGSGTEFGQSAGIFRDGLEYRHGFVENTDTAVLV